MPREYTVKLTEDQIENIKRWAMQEAHELNYLGVRRADVRKCNRLVKQLNDVLK